MARESTGGVQSLQRAFDLLERLADAGGEASLSELAAVSGLPLPTIHRLIRTLVTLGYVRQNSNRRYTLGSRLIRLGETASRQFGTWARPFLARLVDQVGETANLAVMDGDEVVYVAQVPSRHSMRMFTEVGRRVHPHCTAVGKALLARSTDEAVLALWAGPALAIFILGHIGQVGYLLLILPAACLVLALYVGFVAVLLNLLVAVVVTLILRARKTAEGVDGTEPDDYFADEGDPRLEKARTTPDTIASST